MIPFPPFLRGNPYYRNPYNIPRKAYIPNVSSNRLSSNTSSIPMCSPFAQKQNVAQYKNDFHNKTNAYEKYSPNNLNEIGSRIKSGEQYSSNNSNESENSQNTHEPFFSIFGIDLYFDDILILALLLFLNNEDVKDSYLYIVLIMLLLN